MSDTPKEALDSAEGESTSYAKMLEEVEGICQAVADSDIDLDMMVAKVERGYKLIKVMRARLAETRGKIEELRLEME